MKRSMAWCLSVILTATSLPAAAGESVAGTYDGTYRRGNGYPGEMDAGGQDAGARFADLMTALKNTSNELGRKDMALTMLENSPVTARQFGKVIALFGNELTRMEVVRERASQLIDPKNALVFASTFNNSLTAQEYVQVVSSVEADESGSSR